MYHKQKNYCLCFFLGACFAKYVPNSIGTLQGPLQGLNSLALGSCVIRKNGTLAEIITHCHSLTLVVIHSHLLSLVVRFVVTRCTTRCHSLSLAVIFFHSLYHLLSPVFYITGVSLV